MNSSVAAMAEYDRRAEDDPAAEDTDGVSDAQAAGFDLDAFKAIFLQAPYYSTGRAWSDYVPAYQYGRDAWLVRGAMRFEDIEGELERGWDAYRPPSRLAWVEARGAAEHAWRVAKESAHVPPAA